MPGDPDTGNHHLAGGQVAEGEQLLQHLAGIGAQRPLFLGLLDDQLQLLGRVVLIGGFHLTLDAGGLQHARSRSR